MQVVIDIHDGNHDAAPLNDAIICEQLAEADALILFHDLTSLM